MSQLQQNRLPEHFYDEPFALCFSGQGFDWKVGGQAVLGRQR